MFVLFVATIFDLRIIFFLNKPTGYSVYNKSNSISGLSERAT